MKCLFCGVDAASYLCETHITEDALAEVFDALRIYKEELCENEHIREYVSTFENLPEARRACIPEMLELFPDSVSDYYYCRYYKITMDERFEDAALEYIGTRSQMDEKWQYVLLDLLNSWQLGEYKKPRKWCEIIRNSDNLAAPLYRIAAEYFGRVGDYDIADEIIEKASALCDDDSYNNFLFATRENMVIAFANLKESIHKYRTNRPYWPATVERRLALAPIYDEKGIAYPRITAKPKKVKESDFEPINESLDDEHSDYCSFWCAETASSTGVKEIYRIAAIKVREGKIIDDFQSYIKPSSGGTVSKQRAAEDAGVDIAVINSADDVDVVMKKFFDFVGSDVLISTQALGTQAKLISRAARYSGMCKIDNEFFDLLDYAADVSDEFDMKNNTRAYLLEHFNLAEGNDSFEKAKRNIEIYAGLKRLDG